MLLGRLKASWRDVQVMNGGETRKRWSTAALAAFLMMYLDIIIDPVALRGDRWFLGKIYYYPDGGSYFGITLANFLGWYFVCFVIVRLFVSLERVIFAKASKSEQETLGRQEPRINADVTDRRGLSYRYKALGPVGLYFGVLGFNLLMTFRIGERELGVVGVIIVLPLIVMIALKIADCGSRIAD
jgi:putative membrane protein